MLILTRKIDQSILIFAPDGKPVARVMVLGVERDRVKLGIAAKKDTVLLRAELMEYTTLTPAQEAELTRLWAEIDRTHGVRAS